VIAAAIAERQVTPQQFTAEKIMDPVIRAQLNKIVVTADPEIEKVFPELQRVIVRIYTTDGRELVQQLDFPKGDPRNPLTDDDLEEKFEALSGPVMLPDSCRKAMDAIWTLEKQPSVSELMRLFRADRTKAGGP
jgi:2-methylcitrate dehydratase